MDAPQPQRSRLHATDSTHDYLTNLPANVIEYNLQKLPIKDAVKTSILSTKWIDAWVSIPNLVFEQGHRTESAFIKMVDMVFLSHRGPIQRFKISSDNPCNEAIGRWLLVLSRNGIKDLELIFHCNARCKIPFRLISCIRLERLTLCGCSINIPIYFQGFMKLHTLILAHGNLSGISLEKIISSCPILDYLKLQSLDQGCFHIFASNLTGLEIDDTFHNILLEAPKLVSARIYRYHDSRNNEEFIVVRDRLKSNIVRTLGRLSNIQKLQIGAVFINYLAIGAIPEKFPVVFNHLRDISLDMYAQRNEISAALSLFENAPNLEELYIKFIAFGLPEVEAVWESKAIQDRLFKHLKVVKIQYIFGRDSYFLNTKSVLEFARLVLSTAPVLQKLNFIDLKSAVVIFEMLKWFPKLSKNAKIEFV